MTDRKETVLSLGPGLFLRLNGPPDTPLTCYDAKLTDAAGNEVDYARCTLKIEPKQIILATIEFPVFLPQ